MYDFCRFPYHFSDYVRRYVHSKHSKQMEICTIFIFEGEISLHLSSQHFHVNYEVIWQTYLKSLLPEGSSR